MEEYKEAYGMVQSSAVDNQEHKIQTMKKMNRIRQNINWQVIGYIKFITTAWKPGTVVHNYTPVIQ